MLSMQILPFSLGRIQNNSSLQEQISSTSKFIVESAAPDNYCNYTRVCTCMGLCNLKDIKGTLSMQYTKTKLILLVISRRKHKSISLQQTI